MKGKHVNFILGLFYVVMFALPALAREVNISVAASQKDVVVELVKNFEDENPSIKILSNYASSGALAKQIASGAPADLFISANTKWVDFLREKKIADEKTVCILAYNTVVFVGKPDLKVKKMEDITSLDRISIGSPGSVPAGEYAMNAIRKAGLDKQLERKLVMAKDVRACLMYAERGEVNGSFVYGTDALEMAKNVKILFTVPQDLYPRVIYPMALTVSGSKNPEAVRLYEFFKSKKAVEVLRKHGFIVE